MLSTWLWGVFTGVCATLALVWFPSWHRFRTAAQYRRDVRRITGGLAGVSEPTRLDDRDGAFEQARAAYLALYPGRRKEPDPAWVAWVESRPGFYAVDEEPDVWLDVEPVEHVARHRAADPVEAEQQLLPQWSVSPSLIVSFPTWGTPPSSEHVAPLQWRWWEMLLARAILAGSRWSRRCGDARGRLARGRLLLLFALFVALSRFESSGQRVNRDWLESLDDFLEGVVGVTETIRRAARSVGRGAVGAVREVGNGIAGLRQAASDGLSTALRTLSAPFIPRQPSRIRPKRHYYSVIKEG